MTADAPEAPLVLRRSTGDRYAILFIAALMAAGLAALLFGTVASVRLSTAFAIFMGFMTVFMGACTLLVINEAIMRWRTRIVLDGSKIQMILPARRGYVRAPPLKLELRLTSISHIDARLEAFRALGVTTLQRAHSLVLSDGLRVFLGADRRLVTPFYAAAADRIAARIGVPVRQLGMVEGRAGFLMLWGQSVPDWTAAALPEAMADQRVRNERRAWRILGFVFFLVTLAVLLSNFL